METIKEVLMRRDNMDEASADALIKEAKIEFNWLIAHGNFDEAEEICYTFFGLEPDYIMELI